MQHPRTIQICNRLKSSVVVEIEHYKDLFNRPNQDFFMQSYSKKLILAKKETPFLYRGSQYSDSFGFEQFFYAPSILGCMYECSYCYLQGLYRSSNSVIFVNIEDFLDASRAYLDKPTLIAVSYDTDTLAIESIAAHTRAWIELASQEPNLHLEIRTKSANFRAILDLKPNQNTVLAWTLSPSKIIDKYESHTPQLLKRILAIELAISAGWQVRVCIDPVIYTPDFRSDYENLLEILFAKIDANSLHSLTIGSFRVSSAHLRTMKRVRSSELAFYPYSVKDQIATYPPQIERDILHTLTEIATRYMGREKIHTWQR